MDTFAKRILAVLDHFEFTPYKLGKELNFSQSSLSSLLAGKTNPSFEFMHKLLSKFPILDANWLILGKGDMFLNPDIKVKRKSNHPSDLMESKNAIIALMSENIRLKDEKIERLTNELREYRAANELMQPTEKNSAEKAKKSPE
jgi:transcriptional regulator with XRE-family HTH domain